MRPFPLALASLLGLSSCAQATSPPPFTPPPNLPAWQAAVDAYGECVGQHFTQRLAADTTRDVDAAMQMAVSMCAAVRASSVALADAALATHPGYADAARRRAVVERHFQGMEALLIESASGRFDPDKWSD